MNSEMVLVRHVKMEHFIITQQSNNFFIQKFLKDYAKFADSIAVYVHLIMNVLVAIMVIFYLVRWHVILAWSFVWHVLVMIIVTNVSTITHLIKGNAN